MTLNGRGRLQVLTVGDSFREQLECAVTALEAGVRWIQVRVKSKARGEWEPIAAAVAEECRESGATCIVNDSIEIALAVGADGVHLGSADADPKAIRSEVPEGFLIGGTANTFEDVQRLAASRVDYIGLGPLRFTRTKQALAPLLGFEGCKTIFDEAARTCPEIPIVVIGGIRPDDVSQLRSLGAYGVAVSSYIAKHRHPLVAAREFLELFEDTDNGHAENR